MLAYHFGEKQYIKDTVMIDKSGYGTFKADTLLPGGIYLIVAPNTNWFEVVIGKSQQFTLETDSSDMVGKMKVTGSPENEVFYQYQKEMSRQRSRSDDWDKKAKADSANLKLKAETDSVKKKINEEVTKFRKETMSKNPEFLFTKVLKMLEDPEIPEYPELVDKEAKREAQYRYYKAHYFDNFDFADSSILRTPVYHSRVMQYLEKTIHSIPDSIVPEVDMILKKSLANYEVFKYTLITLYNHYINSKVMCMEKVHFFMAKNYYLTPLVNWADTAFVNKTTERVKAMERNLCGEYATELTLQDLQDKNVPLSSIKSDFIIMPFWDPNCGHCQKEMPKLAEIHEKYMSKGVTVYAVCIKRNQENPDSIKTEMEKFVKDKSMTKFVNVWDKYIRNDFRNWYDVYSTPVLYLLDKNKKIIAKRIGIEQLEELLDHLIKERDEELKKRE